MFARFVVVTLMCSRPKRRKSLIPPNDICCMDRGTVKTVDVMMQEILEEDKRTSRAVRPKPEDQTLLSDIFSGSMALTAAVAAEMSRRVSPSRDRGI